MWRNLFCMTTRLTYRLCCDNNLIEVKIRERSLRRSLNRVFVFVTPIQSSYWGGACGGVDVIITQGEVPTDGQSGRMPRPKLGIRTNQQYIQVVPRWVCWYIGISASSCKTTKSTELELIVEAEPLSLIFIQLCSGGWQGAVERVMAGAPPAVFGLLHKSVHSSVDFCSS